MARSDWRTVIVKKSLLEKIESIIKSEEIKDDGITNTSQFIDAALKEKLAKFERKRFEHLSMHEDHVKIIDHRLEQIGRIVSVYVKGKTFCDYCNSPDCIHVQYAWELDAVRPILEKHGLKPPMPRTYGK